MTQVADYNRPIKGFLAPRAFLHYTIVNINIRRVHMASISKPCKICVLLFPSVLSSVAFGYGDLSYIPDMSYIPRIYLQGLMGNNYEAQGDVLAPVFFALR
jgi:hypothetical protein